MRTPRLASPLPPRPPSPGRLPLLALAVAAAVAVTVRPTDARGDEPPSNGPGTRASPTAPAARAEAPPQTTQAESERQNACTTDPFHGQAPAPPPPEPDPRPPHPEHPVRLATVTLDGALGDPAPALARFLGLVPDALYDAALEQRVSDALKALGYRLAVDRSAAHLAPDGRLDLTLHLAPARVVRHVSVQGNWPILRAIFDEDILRRLTLRPGGRLPPADDVPAQLAFESDRVRQYLCREGFFEATVDVRVVSAGRPEWADLRVFLHLGRWFTLGRVEATGATALDGKELAAPFVHSFPPAYFSRFRLDRMHEDARAAEHAYHERGFPAARVFPEFRPDADVDRGRGEVRLRLRVAEKGRVEIHFTGNKELSERELLERVTVFNAGSYDETELKESERELHRLYQQHGFLEARVTARHRREGQIHDVEFLIDEGPELKVRSVDFAPEPGADPLHFTPAILSDQIATRPFPLIGTIGLGGGGYITSLQLSQDADKLAAFYRAEGYPDVRVRGEIARDPGAFGSAGAIAADATAGWGHDMDLFVRFFIVQGRRQEIESVSFRVTPAADAKGGKPAHTPAELARVLGLAPGDPYPPDEAVNAALARVAERYRTSGHPYVTVDPRGSRWDPTHTRVQLVIAVDEGAEVRFGEILLRGNFRTSNWVIRRDLTFSPGDLFDASLLGLAERNLQTHTIFNSVRVSTVPTDLLPGTNPIPILVEVQERFDDWGNLQAAVGYATDIGITGSLGYVWGNVFGGGGNAELRFDAAADIFGQPWTTNIHNSFWRLLSGTARYVHPHLFWPSLRGELSGFYRKESTVALGEVISWGVRSSLGWTPSLSFRLLGRVDFTNAAQLNIEFDRLPGRGDAPATVRDETQTLKLTLGAIYDNRLSFDGTKNPLMPVSGSLVAVQGAVSPKPLGSTHDFVVLSAQAQHYQPIPLGRDLTLVMNARVDWGIPLDEPALPAVERFFAGGDTLTRGFDTDKLRTEIVRYDVGPAGGQVGFRVLPQGGNIRLLGTVELQFPIGYIGPFRWVGAVFGDAGAVVDEWRLLGPADVKVSVGVTIARILTPFGPLSLEYAYPLTQSLAEELWKKDPLYGHFPGRIHFNWGIPILR